MPRMRSSSVAQITADMFTELGFEAEYSPCSIPGTGDHAFLRRRGGYAPPVLLVTHSDTVFPAAEEEKNHFRWDERPAEGRIYGPGVVDNKCAGAAGRGRRDRAQAARGLGHDAGGDRQLPVGGRGPRHPGRDPHRHAQRERLRRGHDRRLQGPHDPHLPHRRRRRRPCAGHHEGRRRGQRAALVDQPDAALHRQHHRRAPRHADGLPPPRRVDRRGPGLRRKPYSPRNDRRRGRAARPGRDQHDEQRQPGHGPRRRGRAAHLADGTQDEGPARGAAGRRAEERQRARSSATSPSTRSTRRWRMASRTRSAASKSASGPTWCCGGRPSSASSRA